MAKSKNINLMQKQADEFDTQTNWKNSRAHFVNERILNRHYN